MGTERELRTTVLVFCPFGCCEMRCAASTVKYESNKQTDTENLAVIYFCSGKTNSDLTAVQVIKRLAETGCGHMATLQ